MEKIVEEMEIQGCVDLRENPITEDEFYERFIGWVESNKWYFGGGINAVKQE